VPVREPRDKPALNALLAFDTYASGAFDPEGLGGLTVQEFQAGLDAGLLFRPNVMRLGHDDVMECVFALLDGRPSRSYTDSFLASLSTGRHEHRAGLPAYASLHRLPPHAYTRPETGTFCAICGVSLDENPVFRNLSNRIRFEVGGLVGTTVENAMFLLQEHARLPDVSPVAADFEIFARILDVLATVPPEGTVKKGVSQALAKIPGFDSTLESRKALLETLGFCGILETQEHGGMTERFVRLAVAPKKRSGSDWEYPVDFGTGRDGVNSAAVAYWFGCYPELEEWTS
jgi:hypothetical protein